MNKILLLLAGSALLIAGLIYSLIRDDQTSIITTATGEKSHH